RGEGSGRRERDGGGLGSGTFEAQWPGFEARCLRFVGWLTPARRKTRFQVLVRLSWAGLLTRRASKKGFRSASYITSPFPKLAWRDPLFLFFLVLMSSAETWVPGDIIRRFRKLGQVAKGFGPIP